MIILPIDDKVKARELLDQAIADKYTITMLLFCDDNGDIQIVNDANIRARALASTRQVVWVRDVNILTDDEKLAYTQNDPEKIVCTLNLDDEPVVHLKRDEAKSIINLERAFAEAQM